MASQWIGTNCPAHCSNTEIPLAERMDCHLLKSSLDIPCKTPSQLIADRLRWNSKNPLRKLKRQHKKHKLQQSYNRNAHDPSALQVGNHVAIQNPDTKMWDIYGVITAIGPFRRYYVKTQSGRVLVRNRRFLRKRSPLSIAAPTGDHYSHISTPTTSDSAI